MTQLMPRADDVRAIRDAHEQFLHDGRAPGIRDLVVESWQRSASAGVDVDDPELPVLADRTELDDYRQAHPLAQVFPLLYDVLGRAAEECGAVLAVGDAHGRLLWVCGTAAVLRRAERISFVEGAVWDETHAGTNAPGTALRLDRPVQILAAEHFARPVQHWTCTAAPIHDPSTQSVLGIVDVTGGEDVASPQTLAMVRAAARMAEAELGRLALAASMTSRLWTPRSDGQVHGLGRPDCLLEIGGRTLRMSPRHSEIVVVLADAPEGRSGDELAVELYAEHVTTSTLRAEMTRLRALLGDDTLGSRPYRLRREFVADWLVVARHLDAGRVPDAVAGYRGPLLPHSDAPGVVRRRERLHAQLRAAVLASNEVGLLAAWTRSRWGADDLDVWREQARLAPPGSPLRAIARSELGRLDRELGLR